MHFSRCIKKKALEGIIQRDSSKSGSTGSTGSPPPQFDQWISEGMPMSMTWWGFTWSVTFHKKFSQACRVSCLPEQVSFCLCCPLSFAFPNRSFTKSKNLDAPSLFCLPATAGRFRIPHIDWNAEAQAELRKAVNLKYNTNVAKNVILFLGDGMGVSTVTAGRIYAGQKEGVSGEEHQLSFEKFPHIGLAKVRISKHRCQCLFCVCPACSASDTFRETGHCPCGEKTPFKIWRQQLESCFWSSHAHQTAMSRHQNNKFEMYKETNSKCITKHQSLRLLISLSFIDGESMDSGQHGTSCFMPFFVCQDNRFQWPPNIYLCIEKR